MSRFQAIMALVGAVTVGLIANAISQASSSSPPQASHHKQAVSHRLRRQFGVFRTAHGAVAGGSGLPSGYAEGLAEPNSLGAEYGLEPAQARYVAVTGTFHVWLVPGSRGVCLAVPAATRESKFGTVPATGPVAVSATCGSVPDAEEGKLLMLSRSASDGTGTGTVVGLAPDGESAVKATKADGSTTELPVMQNVYEGTSAQLQSIAVAGANGSVSSTSLVP
jgi:hypothetical protein